MAEYQRTGRKLKRNHSNALPRYVIAYHVACTDSELGGKKRRIARSFKLATAITYRLRGTEACNILLHDIKQPSEFWELVTRHSGVGHTVWVIGHNILDAMVMSDFTEYFEHGELTIDWPRSKRIREENNHDDPHSSSLCIIDSPPTIIACKLSATQGRVVFVDSLNWFQCPVSELAGSAGLPFTPKPKSDSSNDKYRVYSNRSCQIVAKCFIELTQWVRQNDMGMFRYTAPSQAMAAFRHRFLESDVCVHDNAEVKALERQAFFGGRTEVFKLGNLRETVHQLDVNSLFPSVMVVNEYPCMLHQFEFNKQYSTELPAIDYRKSVAEVIIRTPIPIFPTRIESRLLYPKGRFATTLCGSELAYAKNRDWIVSIKSWAEYRTAPIFAKWVAALWQMRQEYKDSGNLLYDQFAKRLLNSLYGKFAQKSAEWVNVPNEIATNSWSNWVSINIVADIRQAYRSFGWQVQKRVPKGELTNTFVAISAFVTADARMRMNGLRKIVGPSECFYQGVDSLIVTNSGLARLSYAGEVSDRELGRLRLQLSTNCGEILGCSDYVLGGKIVISGRAKDWEVAEGDELLLNRLTGLRYLFNGEPLTTIVDDVSSWSRHSTYKKGNVSVGGWVEPYQLSETH